MPVLVDKRWKGRAEVALVRRAVQETLKSEGVSLSCEVSVVLADDAFIRALNRSYMGIDAPTDVLSFPQQSDKQNTGKILGDIVVSIPTVKSQAGEHGVSFVYELALVVVHSTLHLLGYDHDDEHSRARMWERQDALAAIIFETISTPDGSRKITSSHGKGLQPGSS